jgi:hypothetical protein
MRVTRYSESVILNTDVAGVQHPEGEKSRGRIVAPGFFQTLSIRAASGV